MKKKKFWRLENSVDSQGSTLYLDGAIAQDSWWGDEVTPQLFRDELKEIPGNQLTVVINSGGGDVWAGVSIHDALKDWDGEVTIKVSGLAASIASVIAMAGDRIVMTPGSTMMIHRASMFAFGDAGELGKCIEMLETVEEGIMSIYVDRTGQSKEQIKEMLDAETWMSPEQAVELGFADAVVKPEADETEDEPVNLLTGNLALVMQATKESMASYVQKVSDSEEAKAKAAKAKKTESDPIADKSDPVTQPTAEKDKEISMTEEEKKAAEAKAAQAAAEKKAEDDKAAAIAASQVIAPADQPTADEKPKQTVKNYLKTDDAMEAFAHILEANPGDMGGGSAMKVRNAFKKHLEVTLGVTNPEIFLPTPLITAIQNAFEDGGEIWNRVAKVGADVWNAAWDSEDDVNSNDGRARGYNREDEPEKQEQVLTFDSRVIRPQFVYKYITLNKEDIKEQRSTGALVTYILSELPQRIVREVERAIVLSDGRSDGDDFKIKEGTPRGFYPIINDAEANNFFGGVVTLTEGMSLAEAVSRAKDDLRTPGEVVLIAKKGFSTDARFEKDNEGRLLFPLGTRAQDIFDIDTIIEPDWFNDTNSPDVDAIVVILSAYKVVGDTTIEGFSNFILKTNKQEYLQEIWAGGGLTGRKAAIAISLAES